MWPLVLNTVTVSDDDVTIRDDRFRYWLAHSCTSLPGSHQSRSQSFVPLDQRSENESSGWALGVTSPWSWVPFVMRWKYRDPHSRPQSHDPSDLRQTSRALAFSNTGSPRFTDFPSNLANLIGWEYETNNLHMLRQSSRSLPQVRMIVALGTRMRSNQICKTWLWACAECRREVRESRSWTKLDLASRDSRRWPKGSRPLGTKLIPC